MLSATLRRWAAWAPGRASREEWTEWARNPRTVGAETSPDGRFLPAMLRRRCTPLTKTMLTAAFACCEETERSNVRTVFASRHGSINESIGLLEAIVRRETVSPAKFSHTVHNAQAGLFSIACGNREASSSLSAQEDTFACGYLEALTHLWREPQRPVLFVMGDVPLAETFAHLVDEPAACYAVALLLARDGDGTTLSFRCEGSEAPNKSTDWPDGLEFLRWLLSSEALLRLGQRGRDWLWRKDARPT